MYWWYFGVVLRNLNFGYLESIYMTLYLMIMKKDHPKVAEARRQFAKSFQSHPAARKIFEKVSDDGED